MFVLPDVLGRSKRLFEAAINLAQFPEDQNKENRNYEQPELDVHFIGSVILRLSIVFLKFDILVPFLCIVSSAT